MASLNSQSQCTRSVCYRELPEAAATAQRRHSPFRVEELGIREGFLEEAKQKLSRKE